MELRKIEENGIYLVFGITEENQLKMLHFSHVPYEEKPIDQTYLKECFQLVQVSFSGYDRPYEKHGDKYIVTTPGHLLEFVSMQDTRNELGRKLVIEQADKKVTGAEVVTEMQFYDGLSVVRMTNTVTNHSKDVQTLEYISSFAYTGIEKEGEKSSDEKMVLYVPHHGWQKENNWHRYTFPELGLAQSQPSTFQRTSKLFKLTNTGNWSTKEYLPMGVLVNEEADTSLFWQIEHNGSWHTEISDQDGYFYLNIGGPNELQSHWFKNLQPGESFTTVPVAVGVEKNDFSAAVAQLTQYRRRIRRPNSDNVKLPVIFNDYMNCLWGSPTTEKELPMIDAAAEAGCEYYVIDAGWYAPGEWWDSVGEWQESLERFPNGMKEVTDHIRKKGMIPGVWLELEVMGIHCEMAKKLPDDWFFVRHGKRVYDRSRYQLDFRNPDVRAYVIGVVERVIHDYGVGYIKMDYNIEPGIGTELYADSVGEGLLEHERAYLEWLDEIFAAHPDLVIENCSSGGLRIDYALLSRYSIQSTSDQEDYVTYSTIAANAPAGVTPEQAAVWSYPMPDGDCEETIFNMVNAMLLRIHQSGHLQNLSKERYELVKEGIATYKTIRADIRVSVPFWPLGTAVYKEEWAALGLQCEKKIYLALWRREGNTPTMTIPLADWISQECVVHVQQLYPKDERISYSFGPVSRKLQVTFPQEKMARIFEITVE
ncbi:MAG: glycoside hydrolase family 36 protein [Lachnospiraceae bacterium]